MKSYLDLIYPTPEYSEHEYPQKLCNYISKNYFSGVEIYGYAISPSEMVMKPSRDKLLDVGCGRGNHLVGFRRCGYEVCGLDKSLEALETLKGITVKRCDIEPPLLLL